MSSYDDRGPYFKFFPGDWLSDANTRAMGLFARGLLMDLLAIQWREGHITNDPDWIARVVGVSPSEMEEFGRAWPAVRERFEPDPDDSTLLRNTRLEEERRAFERLRTARRDGGKKGAKRRYGTGGPYVCKGCGEEFATSQALGGHAPRQCTGGAAPTDGVIATPNTQNSENTPRSDSTSRATSRSTSSPFSSDSVDTSSRQPPVAHRDGR